MFATSETVSIHSGNRLIQTVGNVSIFPIFHINRSLQASFDPAGIDFNTFPTMAKTTVEARCLSARLEYLMALFSSE